MAEIYDLLVLICFCMLVFKGGVAFLLRLCHPKNEAKGDPLSKLIVRLVPDLLT